MPRLLSINVSAKWRQEYLDAFIDTSSEHYIKYIASLMQFSDGLHYTGYLWDCLKDRHRITFKSFQTAIRAEPQVFVMADDHSRDRVIGAPLWPYPPYSVAAFEPAELLQSLPSLPEDIYVFDSTLKWTLALTHESDRKRRWCFAAGNRVVRN